MTAKRLELIESDEAGTQAATYVVSGIANNNEERVDVIYPATAKKTLWQTTLDVFLPAGFPHSVTSDYVEYQIYDSLQAFASSIAGLLSSRAVLSSLGVGDSSSSATSAIIYNVLQESAGRIATILFAYRLGTALEPECKMYRLLADVLNDFAFVIDCFSPILPRPLRVLALSCSAILRSLCGVAAGSAKASLSAHFARWGNLGELNAKDSSQETVISLLGMLVGSVVVSHITTPIATWTALILLLAVHLEMNRRAVRAVSLRTMSRQRAGIVFHHLRRGVVPSPLLVSKDERIFEYGGVLRAADGRTIGHCWLGASLNDFLSATAQHAVTKSAKLNRGAIESLLKPFASKNYMLWYDPMSLSYSVHINIALKKGATPENMLLAWWHAIALADAIDRRQKRRSGDDGGGGGGGAKEPGGDSNESSLLEFSMKIASELMHKYRDDLEAQGWDLEGNSLETRPSPRLAVTEQDDKR